MSGVLDFWNSGFLNVCVHPGILKHRKSRNPEIHEPRKSRIPELETSRNSEIQKVAPHAHPGRLQALHLGLWMSGLLDSRIPGFLDSSIPGFLDVCVSRWHVSRFLDSWDSTNPEIKKSRDDELHKSKNQKIQKSRTREIKRSRNPD